MADGSFGPIISARDLPAPYHATARGVLFEGDCLDILPRLPAGIVDTVFSDPPFNLGKVYGRRTNDSRGDAEYLDWCRRWLRECIRILKPGGALFVYNLPRWNILIGAHLMESGMQFRHSTAIEMKSCLPIPGRLYPAHYSLLYFTKGKPRTFRRVRTPIETCRHCGGEIKDYGGHRGAMNPLGVNLKDVWTDIPPVRHWKFKSKERRANALSTKVLDRIVEVSTRPGDLVCDPFGGSGTTFAVCERRGRRWIGIEIDHCVEIVRRLRDDRLEHHRNDDVVQDAHICEAGGRRRGARGPTKHARRPAAYLLQPDRSELAAKNRIRTRGAYVAELR
ncbi:MAG TPA: site-specific DNA-methyltransferase [Stellaceae bacterium]|nr:site-specific DNA-methyltransferase [Stellaceae bacterium]